MYTPRLFLLLALACTAAGAQTSGPAASPLPADGRGNAPLVQEQSAEREGRRPERRIERLRVEDEGSRIDELRVGGETQSITVQPKGSALPQYEMTMPSRPAQNRSVVREGGESTGSQRVWNFLQF